MAHRRRLVEAGRPVSRWRGARGATPWLFVFYRIPSTMRLSVALGRIAAAAFAASGIQ